MTFTEVASTARARLEVGLERHRAGDRIGAERMIRQAAALRPGEPTALYLLGLLRLEADDLDEAETLFGEVLSAAPRHAQSWLTLASIRARRGAAAPAAAAYRRFLELEPGSGVGWIAFSQALLAAGEATEAVVAGQSAVRIASDNPQAHIALAAALAKAGRAHEAAASYRAAIACDDQAPAAHLGLAMAHLQMNQPEAALPPADRALTLDNKLPLGWFALGLALRGAGDPRSARQAFERAAELDPKFAAVHVQLGGLYDEFDDTLASEREWLIVLELNANDKSAHLALSTLYCRAERFDLGRAHAEKALDLDPELIGAHQNLALVEAREGRESEAKRHRDFAYSRCNLFVAPAARPIRRVLVLAGVDYGNSPDRYLLPAHRYTRNIWFVEFAVEGQTESLPRYDVVFNAIGDPDGSASRAPAVARFLEICKRPVLNPPDKIARTARQMAPELFKNIRGLVTPKTQRIAAGAERKTGRLSAPLLIRPLGSHGGFGLELVKTEADLERRCGEAAASHEVYATEFFDYRSPDGFYRKYRMFFVDRRPYPYHLAISDHWLVHYDRSRTAEHPERLAEERRFLEDPEHALGKDAYETIRAVGQRLDLEFAGIDFSLTPEGAVLLFEANATMLVHTERPDSPLAHKNASTERILQAFWTMLEGAAPKSVC